MMKNAIRLLVLAGALLSVGAMAQTSQNWNFTFPSYYFIYTNTASVNFDFTDDTTDGTASVLTLYSAAGLSNLENCIDGLVGNISSVTANASTSSSIGTCKFKPSGVSRSGYSVDWNGLGSADGSLLVVTNASSYKVTVYADSVPAGVDYKVAAELAGNVQETDFTSIPTGQTNAVQVANQDSDYTTQYSNVYVIPLSFAAEVEPTTSATSNTITTVVTYTASAP